MYGCPRSRKKFFERLDRMIGCGHVSGLLMRPDMAASRYGNTRTWRKSIERALSSMALTKCVSGPGPKFLCRPPSTPSFTVALAARMPLDHPFVTGNFRLFIAADDHRSLAIEVSF